MLSHVTTGLLLATALGSGLLGGLFFAFSSFVMRALDRRPPAEAVAAMQAINVTVLNPLFFLVFFGTGVTALTLGLFSLNAPTAPCALAALIGTLLYLLGGIGVTVARNVPLNQRLAAVRGDEPDPAAAWRAYYGPWTAWNHVRTIACLAASLAFMVSLISP